MPLRCRSAFRRPVGEELSWRMTSTNWLSSFGDAALARSRRPAETFSRVLEPLLFGRLSPGLALALTLFVPMPLRQRLKIKPLMIRSEAAIDDLSFFIRLLPR